MSNKKRVLPAVQQVIRDSKNIQDNLLEQFSKTKDLGTAETALAAGRNVIAGARTLLEYKQITGEVVDFDGILK